ncbi:nitrogen fixation negative regulator NifL [Vibrio ulleungensis]|uniref:histidine kinase n=2 Tax=Vibrio TaxID=662 RepID=A0ABS2HDA7_9VIBR|nr:nitrogen fixation negative regulator NifL [Vibrio ulleungensis]MBM7035570.1 nitrogen fixation negative regulator NifL [Vibrio ulleungensis]
MEQTSRAVCPSITQQLGLDAFEHIVDHAPTAISITDDHGRIIFANQSFLDITGYSEPEILGQNSSILSYKMTPKSVYQHLWSTISNGLVWRGQLINKRKNGALYVADVSISSLSNADGKIFYYAIQQDITDTHKLQTEQKNQSALFHAVLNSAPIAMALLDDENHPLYSNQRYQQLTSTLLSSPTDIVLDQLQGDHQCTSISQYLGTKDQRTKSIYVAENRQGDEKWFDVSLVKIPVNDTKTESYFQPLDEYFTLIGVIDRTKDRQYIEEKRLNTISQRVNDNKFVHSMQEVMMATLHQLQGPLNMVESAVTILKQTNHSCPGLTAMDDAMASASKALLDIHQAIPERPPEVAQPINLNESVRDAISISTKSLLNNSINISLDLAASLNSINGKPNRLLLALKQLIDNSIDAIQVANPTERALVVSTSENLEESIITIDDSGTGILDEHRLKVFQPFFSTKSKAHSSCRGIGLAIVHQVMTEHSAMIEINKSHSLGGCSIRLIFPKSWH